MPSGAVRPSAAPTAQPPVAPRAKLFEDGVGEAGFLPRGEALALGIDGAALDRLVLEAEATKSDALLVLKDGRVVVERSFGSRRGPIETMSVTKSITALAVLLLIEQGKIPSLDAPLSGFLPDFSQSRKAEITLRHLLEQTSGLAHGKDARALNGQKDRTRYARGRAVTEPPGATFSYNNEATQLLSAVVERAAGKPVDAYLDQKLFRPLGIRGWQWDRDGAGNVQTYYGLALTARDLGRIGQLLLDQGSWQGARLISAEHARALATPSAKNPYYGLLWWIRYERVVHVPDAAAFALLSAAGFGAVDDLRPLFGGAYRSPSTFWLEAGARLEPAEREALAAAVANAAADAPALFREQPEHALGFYADGSLGQRLAIFPESRLVVVRQRRRRPAAEESEALSFPGMLKLSAALPLERPSW